MKTELYVISGFLGAGKTTLVQKLLKETFQEEKVVVIENDFGEISGNMLCIIGQNLNRQELCTLFDGE